MCVSFAARAALLEEIPEMASALSDIPAATLVFPLAGFGHSEEEMSARQLSENLNNIAILYVATWSNFILFLW